MVGPHLASRLLLAVRTAARVLRGKIFKAARLTVHFEVVRKRLGLGRCFVKLRHGTIFGTSSSVMASRERILKTSLFHLLAVTRLRRKLDRNLSPKTNKQKMVVSFESFLVFLVNLSRWKRSHTRFYFFSKQKTFSAIKRLKTRRSFSLRIFNFRSDFSILFRENHRLWTRCGWGLFLMKVMSSAIQAPWCPKPCTHWRPTADGL